MDDLFPIIMFIVFFLAPLLEGLKRKNKENKENKQDPPLQTRRPLPRAPQQRLPQPRQAPGPSRTEEISAKSRTEENAAAMVPDDLWEILTGQKRSPGPTTPPPSPEERKPLGWDVVFDAEEDEEAETGVEATVRDDLELQTRRTRGEARSLETLERHPQPVVVSLEENLPTTAQRHAAFHKKISEPAIVVEQPRRKRLLDFSDRAEVQRAFLLQEVLGKPKGLE